MRVIQWIVNRVTGAVDATDGVFGRMPRYSDLNWHGIDFSQEKFRTLTEVTGAGASAEAEDLKEFFKRFGDRLPKDLELERRALEQRAKKLGSFL